MRIAVNATIIDETPSGLGVYASSLLKEMAALHDDLFIYTSCPMDGSAKSVTIRPVTPLTRPSRGRWGHMTRLSWLQTVLPGRLLGDQATALFCPVTEGLLFPFLPQVVVVHDLHPLLFPKFWPQQYYYFRYIVPSLLMRSKAIITDSETTRRDIARFYELPADRISVIFPGYDLRGEPIRD